MQRRRDTGRFVMALGVMAIIVVMSTVFAAALTMRESEVSITPDRSDRRSAELRR
ncbi:MAG: hypothetical protein WB816_13025 [Methylocystis sp.]